MNKVKRCKKCGEEKLLEEFYDVKSSKDGLGSWCCECHNRRTREWRAKNRDKIIAERVRRTEKRKNDSSERIKFLANRKISSLIAAGKIIRPNIYSECKLSCKPEAHHPDYSYPLEVIWLCSKCHTKLHRQLRRNNVT